MVKISSVNNKVFLHYLAYVLENVREIESKLIVHVTWVLDSKLNSWRFDLNSGNHIYMYQPMFAFGVERCFPFLNTAFAIIIRFIYFSALFKR